MSEGLKKNIIISVTLIILVAIGLYIGIAIYYNDHYYKGTTVNNIDISKRSIEDAKEKLKSTVLSYQITVIDKNNNQEIIHASDINLTYTDENFLDKVLENQRSVKWMFERGSKHAVGTTYDKESLKKRVSELNFLGSNNVVEPVNAQIKYQNDTYTIVKEDDGNKFDLEALQKEIQSAVDKRDNTINLTNTSSYIKAEYTSTSEKIVDAMELLNKYISTKITYEFSDSKEILDKSTINQWIIVNNDYSITIDESKIKDYVNKLSNSKNRVAKLMDFNTSLGEKASLGKGDYGYFIDKDKEVQEILKNIKEGKIVTRQPSYIQSSVPKDENIVGNTYVEISIANQHLWFYKNGELVADGDIVTGNMSNGNSTPKGVYRLKYKQKKTVLRGPGYAAPVDFWMPFNGGVGIHDATWRTEFGGEIYKTNGSHGCINCPYELAKIIYENIDPSTPVVVY